MNSVEHKNTPVVQKYLGRGEEYLEKGKLHDEEGPPRSSHPDDEGRPDEECNFPFFKYSTTRPKYFLTNGVFLCSTEFITRRGVIINR